MPKNTRSLVLNNDYTALGAISWKRAITLSIINYDDPKHQEGLIVVDYYKDDFIQATNDRHFPVPAVVVSPYYIRTSNKVPFARKNVYLRDQMICQYCGKGNGTAEGLTYDHVIPRTQWKKLGYKGTPTKWENIVTACNKCNRYKANRTPNEAKMKLLKQPKIPHCTQYIMWLSPWSKIPVEWEPYLTPMYKHLLRKKLE